MRAPAGLVVTIGANSNCEGCLLRNAIAIYVGLFFTSAAVAEEDFLSSPGVALHAFDHLGNLGEQAPAAAACGFSVIYGTGFGSLYTGMPAAEEMKHIGNGTAKYLKDARARGIRLAIGYVCATSIVKLETFDRNWPGELRARLKTPPADWLQRDRENKPLASWYGGDYRPACMNHPDWRSYTKYVVKLQLEAGFDGIFFDNPTVHPDGCYCDHCMAGFGRFLGREGSPMELRGLAAAQPEDFRRYRATIGADFLADIRAFARTIRPKAIITCNNSLNGPGAMFSQIRTYGYDIHALSAVEDLVVVEDMSTQPRVLADGSVLEYGPVYEMLHGISHHKPVVAVTVAEADYHTPANLTRLAMAEAAAHGASYMLWPTWPEGERQRMIEAVRPEAELLRGNAELLKDTKPRADVVLYLPYNQWMKSGDCRSVGVARAMGGANVQFRVVCEDDFRSALRDGAARKVVIESAGVLRPVDVEVIEQFKSGGGSVVYADKADWLAAAREKSTIRVSGPATVRAVVRDQGNRTVVHLLNLNVLRVSSFEDRVTAAAGVHVEVRVPGKVGRVKAITADVEGTRGELKFSLKQDGDGNVVEVEVPRIELSTMLVVE